MSEESLLFVKIDNPIEIRRSLLEGSKSVIELLRRYEKIKIIRTRKAEEIMRLKNIMKDIGTLMARLKNEMPDVKVKLPKQAKKEQKKEPGVVHMSPLQKKSSSITELNNQLQEIEAKLNKLG